MHSTDPEVHIDKLLSQLKEKNFQVLLLPNTPVYRALEKVDVESHYINVSKGSLRYNSIVQLTRNQSCMPYIQYNGVRYVSID